MTTQPNQFSLKDYFVEILRNGQKINEPQNPEIAQQQANPAPTFQQNQNTPFIQNQGIPVNAAYNPMNGQSQVKSGGEKMAGLFGALLKGGN